MRLCKNMFSLGIYKNYENKLMQSSNAMNRIGSGIKLDKAKDNPNKVAQNEMLKIQILCNDTARKNIQDTNSMIQTYDGSMQEMNSALARVKELTIRAGGPVMTDSDLKIIQGEIDELLDHVDSIAKTTEFNGVKLLDGVQTIDSNGNIVTSINSVIGESNDDIAVIKKHDLTLDGLKKEIGITTIDVTDTTKLNEAIKFADKAINIVSNTRSEYGAVQLRLENSIDSVDTRNVCLQKAQSRIGDADIAEEMVKYSQSQIVIQASIALMSQSNNLPQDALKVLQNMK